MLHLHPVSMVKEHFSSSTKNRIILFLKAFHYWWSIHENTSHQLPAKQI